MSMSDDARRQAVLEHPEALDCNLYRPHERDPEAEELDLGDARVLFGGPFEPPADWDAQARADYFGDDDPALFFEARIQCLAPPGARGHFSAEVGDYLAAMPRLGEVVMYYLHDCLEDDGDRRYVLLRDDQPLD